MSRLGIGAMRLAGTGTRHLVAGGVAMTLLLAGCTGFGVSTPINPWEQICQDTEAYLAAVRSGDRTAIEAGVRALQRHVTLEPDASQWLQEVADAAANGDPKPARQNYLANCAPLPSPS